MKDLKLMIATGVVLLTIFGIVQYNKPKPVNWQITLSALHKIPYGSYILYNQLGHIFGTKKVERTNQSLYNVLRRDDVQGNYIIIAKTVTTSKTDYESLTHFIKAGNNVFITALNWKGVLPDTLKLETRTLYGKHNAGLNFTNRQLRKTGYYTFNRDVSNQYFSTFDTAHAEVLGKNNKGYCNFLRYKLGKGYLYLCATPMVFTNYSLLTPQGADYAAKALSYLPTGQNIYWDQYQNKDIPADDSPLRVIFSYDSLRWAYYIALITILVFVAYEAKRTQRVIPVIEPLKNTTLDFVNVVGQVYYENRNNSNMAHKKITYLLEHWRSSYYLKTNILNLEFAIALSQKTGIELNVIKDLINQINYIYVQPKVTDEELIELNRAIEKFYSYQQRDGKRDI